MTRFDVRPSRARALCAVGALWALTSATALGQLQSPVQSQPQGGPALVPPPPPMPADSALEPQVTIVKRGEDTVEEYRLHGRLYMIKVTPPHGRPYYLVDNRGDGHFAREEPLDSGLRVPMWVIQQF